MSNDYEQQTGPRTEAELELELQKVRSENLAAQERLADHNEKIEENKRQIREQNFASQLRRQIAASGIKFYSPDSELKQIVEGVGKVKFLVGQDGQFSCERDGKNVKFEALLETLAVEKPFLADQRTTKHLSTPKEELSKESFSTPAAKSNFIEKFGLETWSALPLHPPQKVDLRSITGAQYVKLSASVKAKLGLSESQISEILKRKP